ncbi:hypothetical protein AEA09_07100 [Lysinibacillus contaminans]|uniref:Glycerol kinase n=1 Tax=Lysinibacillus contaminans TaxID=1293441 RepID=A0ABR5K0D7_9BACI|nr:glycerol kinase GlpK [Lysinibacillus contaminans]KOS68346.1 hypothetical protein AEA09_07100 [Lysinibacillus contaminans]
MGPFILTIDQSTSGTKVLLINQKGDIVHKLSVEHEQIYPQPGWLEHDPIEIYQNTQRLLHEIVQQQNLSKGDIHAISITNQRETCLLWNKDGQPIQNAIVWQCNRTAKLCEQYISQGHAPTISEKTGLLISPYFSATKLQWLLNAHPQASQAYAGTMDSWLIYNLTNKMVHATDYTNACRTLLFNIHTLSWDDQLLDLFNLKSIILPNVLESDASFGIVSDPNLPDAIQGTPICGVIGDSQAALFAHGCFKTGTAKATLGTGSSVLMNIGENPLPAKNGLVTTIAWKLSTKTSYALEGIIYSAADTLSWAKNNLGLFQDYNELMAILKETPSSEGVIIIPAFYGIGAPYWNVNAKATIYGLSRSSTRSHLLKACSESIAHQIRDVISLLSQETSITLQTLRCDGGASANQYLIQDMANFLQLNIHTTNKIDLSPLGASFICGLALGWWDMQTIAEKFIIYSNFEPKWDLQTTQQKQDEWEKIVQNINAYY